MSQRTCIAKIETMIPPAFSKKSVVSSSSTSVIHLISSLVNLFDMFEIDGAFSNFFNMIEVGITPGVLYDVAQYIAYTYKPNKIIKNIATVNMSFTTCI